MIKRHSIEAVINAAAIDEVVGDYIALKKRGANLLGRCPFHDEKTPSFTVSPAKGIYKCFGCGKSGNSVSFLMEHDNLSFSDAIKQLAAKYNITLEEDLNVNKEEYDEAQKNREALYISLKFAKDFFVENLNESEGKLVADTYFRERGFTQQTIQEFELGYSPQSWDALVNKATENKFNLDYFVSAGLIKKNEERNSYFDLFRHRVIFPIHDLTGKVIAFGGRQLVKDDKSPKYLNSPETDVYHKSQVLYGIFQAKKSIKQINNCYLVEGYTDVITLHQAGINNVVASSGTALTEGQIKLIRRFSENVTVLYDGDFAGIKASLRGIDLILQQGLNVRCVSFPDGEDPDSYCHKLGAESFKKYLESNSKDFILFKIDLLFADVNNDPIKKTEAVKNLIQSIALIPDNLKRASYVRECSKLVDMDERLLSVEVDKIRRNNGDTIPQNIEREIQDILQTEIPQVDNYHAGEEQEKNLIRILIQSGFQKFQENATVVDFIFKELEEDEALSINNELYNSVIHEVKQEVNDQLELNEQFFINHQNSEIRKLAADFLTDKYELSPYWKDNGKVIKLEKENYIRDLQSVFLFLKLRKLEKLIQLNLEELAIAETEHQKLNLTHYHLQLLEVKNSIANILGAVVV